MARPASAHACSDCRIDALTKAENTPPSTVADAGEGVKWSADRASAWRLQDGNPVGSISLDVAKEIAARVGLPVPAVASS